HQPADIGIAAAAVPEKCRAVKAGEEAGTVKIMDIEEVPLAYLPGSETRIRVKAIGDLVIG
ncbi:hydantoinase/oxoprolinase family protein, partial [Rhizobium leguminosarum]